MAAFASAQDKPATSAIVEVRIQISWWMEPSRQHPLVTSVTLEPLDHKSVTQNLRLSENSTSIVRLPAGRYQVVTTSPVLIGKQAYGWSIEVPLFAPVNYIRLSQENAVKVTMDDAIEAVPASLGQPMATPAANDIAAEQARVQIMALLHRWTTSLKSRNLPAQMSCYAPQLATYHAQRNVSREQVQLQKQKLLRLYPQIRRLELSDIDLRVGATEATLSAIKTWNFSNDEVDWQGRALIDLEFAKINSRWVITSERERPVPERSVPRCIVGSKLCPSVVAKSEPFQ